MVATTPVTVSVVDTIVTAREPGSCSSAAKPPVSALRTRESHTMLGVIMPSCAGVSVEAVGPPKCSETVHLSSSGTGAAAPLETEGVGVVLDDGVLLGVCEGVMLMVVVGVREDVGVLDGVRVLVGVMLLVSEIDGVRLMEAPLESEAVGVGVGDGVGETEGEPDSLVLGVGLAEMVDVCEGVSLLVTERVGVTEGDTEVDAVGAAEGAPPDGFV